MTKIYKTVTITNVKSMTKSRCEIKDPDRVLKIINDLISGGASKLQVLSDFDYTITKQCLENGSLPPTSFKIFNKCKSVPASFLDDDAKLRQVYRPLEIDPNITQEEKAAKMREWWEKSADLFREANKIALVESFLNLFFRVTAEAITMTRPYKMLSIAQLKAMTKARCEVKDNDRVLNIINELIGGGLLKLQVLSDFDFTITKQHLADNKIPPTSFGLFNSCRSIPQHFLEETDRLYRTYRPIEVDPHISTEEKTEKMIEWWTKSVDVFKGFPFNPQEIDEVASECADYLRDGARDLFLTLSNNDVPILVFSAGLGDCVVSILKHFNVFLPNVKVVSNFLRYKDGHLDGFVPPIIHIFNKNEQVLKGTEYYESVRNRDHIILMGDSLGDAEMATGVPASSHVLKIGFLYDHVELNLPKYMDAFDIVLVNDQTMDLPRALVSLIQNDES